MRFTVRQRCRDYASIVRLELDSAKVKAWPCRKLADDGAVDFVVGIGEQMLGGVTSQTGSWDDSAAVDLGSLNVAAAGQLEVRVLAKERARWQAINLRAVTLTPE